MTSIFQVNRIIITFTTLRLNFHSYDGVTQSYVLHKVTRMRRKGEVTPSKYVYTRADSTLGVVENREPTTCIDLC